jgi:hypothetical protein
MAASLKAEWRMLRRGKPGQRFQDRYDSGHHGGNSQSMTGRIVRIVIAVVCVAIGVVLMFIPGPAILFFLIAGGLLAAESRHVARALDWSEVRLRKLASWAKARWKKLPLAGKIVVGMVLLALGAAGMYVGYRMMFG